MKTLALLILSVASVALADDFKTITGKEYKNAKVSRVEPDGIVITFSSGIVKIPARLQAAFRRPDVRLESGLFVAEN